MVDLREKGEVVGVETWHGEGVPEVAIYAINNAVTSSKIKRDGLRLRSVWSMTLDGFKIELHIDATGRCVGGAFSRPDDY